MRKLCLCFSRHHYPRPGAACALSCVAKGCVCVCCPACCHGSVNQVARDIAKAFNLPESKVVHVKVSEGLFDLAQDGCVPFDGDDCKLLSRGTAMRPDSCSGSSMASWQAASTRQLCQSGIELPSNANACL